MESQESNGMISDEQLDALLDAADRAGQSHLEIHARIQDRRRRRAHAKAKAKQPEFGIRSVATHDAWAEILRTEWRRPLDADDVDGSAGALDYLLLTVQDTVDIADFEDMLFALLRVARKAWAWNRAHLGPIEGMNPKGK